VRPKLHPVWYATLSYSLRIGIAYDEVYSFDVLAEHVVDCIAATSSNTNYFDDGRFFFW
jgi:hypothetical protein